MTTRTIPLPAAINVGCAAGPMPMLSIRADGSYIIHPDDYDPDIIADEDLIHDCCIRQLRADEVDALADLEATPTACF